MGGNKGASRQFLSSWSMCKQVDAALNLQLQQIYMLGTTFKCQDSCTCDYSEFHAGQFAFL